MQVAAISVDSLRRNQVLAEELKIGYLVLSDRDRRVCRAYGVLDEVSEVPRVAVFVIDAKGMVRWSFVTDDYTVEPMDDRILQEVKKLKTPT